jgi:hypothetical protein
VKRSVSRIPYAPSGSNGRRRKPTSRSEIHKLINSVWKKEELSQNWKEFIVASVYKNGDETNCNITKACHCYRLHTKFYPAFFYQCWVHMRTELLEAIIICFHVTDQNRWGITFYSSDAIENNGVRWDSTFLKSVIQLGENYCTIFSFSSVYHETSEAY